MNLFSLLFITLLSVVSVPHAAALEPANTGRFSAAFWYKAGDICANPLPRLWEKGAQYMAVMGGYDNCENSETHRVAIEVSNGVDHTEFWARPTRLVEGNWYHIVGTFDQFIGEAAIYIDGKTQTIHEYRPWADKSPQVMTTNPNKPFLIGNKVGGSRAAMGHVTDFLFYDRVISPDEVQQIMRSSYPQQGLVMHHPLDEGEGDVSLDISGNGHHGTIIDALWTSDVPVRPDPLPEEPTSSSSANSSSSTKSAPGNSGKTSEPKENNPGKGRSGR